jgi:hypothetical protein
MKISKMGLSQKGQTFVEFAIVVGVIVGILILIFNFPIRGSLVSLTKAQEIAHQQLSPDAEITGRAVWFVSSRGCEKGEVAMFFVQPYEGKDKTMVDNAVICAGWPFKGMTPRFR